MTSIWKSVALPVEHGGWSLLIEPLLLGLAIAPSFAGGCLALSAVAAFLTRHPLKLAALDRRRGVRYRRTGAAEHFFAGCVTVAAFFLIVAVTLGGVSMLIPLALAAPMALVAAWHDLQGRGREALPEIAGAVALGASSAAIILGGGGPATTAWLAWALLSGRGVTAILYVRARVRADRGVAGETRARLARPVMAVHALALTVAGITANAGFLSPVAASAFPLLTIRAIYGLAPGSAPIRAQTLGIQEVLIGFGCLALFASGLA